MSNFVFVLDTHKRPLNPIRPGMARKLLTNGKAAVHGVNPDSITINSHPDSIAEAEADRAQASNNDDDDDCKPTYFKDFDSDGELNDIPYDDFQYEH